MKVNTSTLANLTRIGSVMLIVGAGLMDLGAVAHLPFVESLGNAGAALAGLGLIALPFGLRASGIGGDSRWVAPGIVALLLGIGVTSLVDVPAIFDPTNLAAGQTFGPVGLVLLSAGFLLWFAAIHKAGSLSGWRKWIFLLAGLWFVLTFPTIQLPLFVVPFGRPSFLLLAGAHGVAMLLMGKIIRERAESQSATGLLGASSFHPR
ncbi:MAG: hypothetical protein H7Y32_21385 [Chloroflexales bacterium]|nr:hypothetical protein [Chloroflexales bacterium]